MSLKNLIQDQVIKIDDHKRGSREMKNWDDPTSDVHIDKTTNFPVNGKLQDVRIRVPLNSERDIKIMNAQKNIDSIPNSLRKEIKNAFGNKSIREGFIRDVVSIIENFSSLLNSRTRAEQAVKRIAKHFDLDWSTKQIADYVEGALSSYTELYRDRLGNKFFITISDNQIKVGQNTGEAYSDRLESE